MQYSVVNLQEAKRDNSLFRIDADFYRRDLLELEQGIMNKEWDYLRNLSHSIVNFGAYSLCNQIEFLEEGVPYLNVGDIRDGIINHTNSKRIDASLSENVLWKSLAKEGQVLLTIAGTIGNAAVATNLPQYTNSNQAIANISLSNRVSPYYLTIFLNSKYGKGQTKRLTISSVQPNLLLTQVKQIKTYIPSSPFQETVANLYKTSLTSLSNSARVFSQAQSLLLTELGLANWQPKHHLTFVRNSSNVEQAGRIDAEYFQPKYDEIENTIKKYAGGNSFIKKEFEHNKSTFEIQKDKTYQYVEIGSVNVSTGEIDPKDVLGEELPANAKRVLAKGDVIISKVRTYRGAIAIVKKNGFVGSGAFTILRENGRINKETLFAFLHSKPLLAWSLKPNTGTSYPVIVDNDILNLPIPLFSQDIQNEIQQKVSQSFALRARSKKLLEAAKRAVEIAIEENEEKALAWLEKETNPNAQLPNP